MQVTEQTHTTQYEKIRAEGVVEWKLWNENSAKNNETLKRGKIKWFYIIKFLFPLRTMIAKRTISYEYMYIYVT